MFYDRLIDDKDRKTYFSMVKSKCQRFFKVDLSKILFPHMLGGSSVVNDEHLRMLFFGDYMYPEVNDNDNPPIIKLKKTKKNNHDI